MEFTREQLQGMVDDLQPWHYSWQFPFGITTGQYPTGRNEKLELMNKAGAWPYLQYPKVLDLGANSGMFSKWFADNKMSKVTAVEYSTGSAFHSAYRQLCLMISALGYEETITPWCKDILEGDYGTDEFDLILFLGVLHHCGPTYHGVIFQSCFNALRSGGDIVVQTKEDQFVIQKLRRAGFVDIHQLPNYRQQDRLAWLAKTP